jgi:8-oxo-dGTP pyrophosphatase MutT (NUDIX family)
VTDLPTVVYLVREHPETAIDELIVFNADGLGPAAVTVVRELGIAEGTRYLHAKLDGTPDEGWAWETLRVGMAAGPFVDDLVRRRAVVYATRERDGRTELLTIETLEYPEEGIQVPAGRIDHGESLEDGLLRELAEETGVAAARIVRELPDFECNYRNFSHNHAFHVEIEDETPDDWEHRVVGNGADAGLTHHCRWVRFSADLPLWNVGDPMLAKLPPA